MIAKTSIENLSQRLDIVDIISHFIEVKKQGASYVCLCPFHADKNPSMHINAQKGFYHCFACKAGGDAFKFVMDYEKLKASSPARSKNPALKYTFAKAKNKNSCSSLFFVFSKAIK